jgi:hypothetical protein
MHRRRSLAAAGRAFLGAVQRSCALFETGAMIPEAIGKGRIALDRLPTAGTFLPLECIAELYHTFSSLWLSRGPRE